MRRAKRFVIHGLALILCLALTACVPDGQADGTFALQTFPSQTFPPAAVSVPAEEHICGHVCKFCGKCEDTGCEKEPCIEKCDCSVTLSDRSAFTLDPNGVYSYGEIPLISGTGTQLYAIMYLPTTDQEQYTTVIMLHGLNATADGMAIMARELVQYGYACLTFDFVNGSSLSKSGHDMKKMSVLTEKADLLAVMEQIARIDYIDQNNIFLYSESQGGMVTVASIPELAGRVNGLILSYPALHIPEKMRGDYPNLEEVPDTVKLDATTLGGIYVRDVYDLDAWELCQGYTGPVLIMHGTEDTSVDIQYSKKALENFPDAVLEIIEGAGHGFSLERFRVPAMKLAADFVAAHEDR